MEDTNNASLLYYEWVPAGKIVKYIITGVILLIILISGICVLFTPSQLVFFIVFNGVLLVLFCLLYLNFRGITIKLDEKQLSVRYGHFNHKIINYYEINDFKITTTPFSRYGGVGVRLGVDGSWAYTTDLNGAVAIYLKQGRPFVFSTKNPEKIIEILKKQTQNH
ncbi:MAG: hypothetical protein ACTSQY_02225 [Candidatus Odinarchaeia archaeon]